jgi:HD-GYP domain-containing protein (c-di-GMP phosphodiesterase class II)
MQRGSTSLMGRSDPAFRMRVVNVGILVTLGLGAAYFVYCLLTWSDPHRQWLALIALAATADGLLFYALRTRIVASSAIEWIFFGWNVAHVVAASVACYLDGGPASPYVLVLYVSIVFAAVSLPRRYVYAIAAVDLAALLAIAAATDSWPAGIVPLAGSLVAVGLVGAAVASEQHARLTAVEQARTEMLRRLARVIEFRDVDTGTHVERMSEYCALIAARLGWGAYDIDRLRVAAPMHDIGKVAVPDQVLLKPGPLTPEERRVMERHTTVGHEMLSDSSSAEIELAAEIALTHHEHFDGGGYPRGLCGADIPIAGRIVAIADVFDALTSDRVYRPAMSIGDALQILDAGRGRQFDPKVLDAFNDALDEILAARGRNQDPTDVTTISSAQALGSARA